ncbi:MAG: SusC/RagA family TonB-linked outer membrane protein [Acholeplasmataceae bacterium]|nr:SusC/RagA family TonB-linked outer membrane protein [Acholeplasmataceae bacterium]
MNKKWRYLLALIVLLGCFVPTNQVCAVEVVQSARQSKSITGVVKTTSGEPVIGASILIQGTARGTITNVDGKFSLDVSQGTKLIISAVGYKKVELTIGKSNSYTVTMEEDTQTLGEVVVTAMGIKKEKKALGYSVQELKSDELMKVKTANPLNSLAGKIAGVTVTQAGGAAGSGAEIILRGGTSLERDNQPLFVVDGIIYDNQTSVNGDSSFDGMMSTTTTNSNRVMDINPEDIESMSVLKGQAAAALYGSRASAGAIIITTKKGKEGSVLVNFSSKLNLVWANRLPEQQKTYKRGYYNANGDLQDYTTESWGEAYGANDKAYNNISDFFKTGSSFDNSVSVSGGTKDGNFYLSASRFDQNGIIPTTDFDKTTFRFNGEQKYGKLTIGANVAYSQAHTTKSMTSAGLYGSGGNGTMTSVYTWAPSDDMTHYLNTDGSKYRMFAGKQDLADDVENPYWQVHRNSLKDDTERITGNIHASYDIFDWWNISYRAGVDSYTTTNNTFIAPGGAVKIAWQNGMMSENEDRFRYLSSNLMTNFKYKISDFDFSLMLGTSVEDWYSVTNRRLGFNFASDFYSFANIEPANKSFQEIHYRHRLVGTFGEFNASWKNMLYLGVTGRNDWSSTLPPENRSYFYPAANIGFIFSELLPKNNILTYGKVRASIAGVGKDTDPYETNTSLWGVHTQLGGLTGLGNNWNRGNPYLKPERTKSYELGLETRFFNGRLGFDATYYSNKSYNQIISPRLSQTTGYIFCSVNAGDVRNKGIEISLTGQPIKTRDLTWETTLNLSHNKGTVEKLISGVDILYVTDVQVGNAKAASFNNGKFMGISGSQWARTDKGQVILDKYGMPTWDGESTHYIGNREPKIQGGLNNSIQYKNWNLSFLLDFRLGGAVYNGTEYMLTNNGLSKRTLNRETLTIKGVVNTGTTDTPVYEDKTFTYNAGESYDMGASTKTSGRSIIQDYWGTYYPRESSNFMTQVNWLRLRSVTLSYSCPQSLLTKLKYIKGCTFSVTGTNLLLLTNYKGLDPEASAAGSGTIGSSSVGFDYCGVPATAGMSFGVNLTF